MKNFSKNIALWIIIGLLLVSLFNLFQNSSNNRSSPKISFSDFIAATEAGNISEVTIIGNHIEGYLDDGRPFTTYSPKMLPLGAFRAGNAQLAAFKISPFLNSTPFELVKSLLAMNE